MFRRSALPAAASLAVVLLAVTGCKIQVSADPGGTSTAGGASTAGAVQAGTSGPTRSGPLIVEPGAGFSPVYSLINGARHSIDVTMYEFSSTSLNQNRELGQIISGHAVMSAVAGTFASDFRNGKHWSST
jgi:hypothetical protein